MNDNRRCKAVHNPGVWPYTARCVKMEPGHGSKHEDKDGNTWLGQYQDNED